MQGSFFVWIGDIRSNISYDVFITDEAAGSDER